MRTPSITLYGDFVDTILADLKPPLSNNSGVFGFCAFILTAARWFNICFTLLHARIQPVTACRFYPVECHVRGRNKRGSILANAIATIITPMLTVAGMMPEWLLTGSALIGLRIRSATRSLAASCSSSKGLVMKSSPPVHTLRAAALAVQRGEKNDMGILQTRMVKK